MRMKMKKKANVLLILLTLVFVFYVMVRVYMISSSKINRFESLIGDQQMNLINTYQKGEKALFFMDLSVLQSLRKAIYQLAQDGGVTSDCSDYYGYSIWNGTCVPESMKQALIEKVKEGILGYYGTFAEPIPVVDYDIVTIATVGRTEVGLLSQKSVRMDVNAFGTYNFAKDDLSTLPQPEDPDPPETPPPPNPPAGGSGGIYGKCSNVAEYALKYVGCPYALDYTGYTTPDKCFNIGLTCAALVKSVLTGVLGEDANTYGNGNENCNSASVTKIGTDLSALQSGDIFSAEYELSSGKLSAWGHTGMYVGRGKLSEPKAYWGKNCYLKYTPDPNGEPIFIHSIGNQNFG
ncbi:MAG: hypothetical protein HGA85_08000, partial [Nanoarchaeota archaeon]|nr:hypothetical protein [Nanoarchaeota archaeon]